MCSPSSFSYIPSALHAESKDRQYWAAAAGLKADPSSPDGVGGLLLEHYIPWTGCKALLAMTSILPGCQGTFGSFEFSNQR